MVDYTSKDLGNLLGKAIKESDGYRQDLAQSEEVSDINIVNIDTVNVGVGVVERKKFIVGCDISGVNGGVNPFVLDHPVNGELDSPNLYIDGTWCSTEVVYTDFSNYYDFIVDENEDFLVDIQGNNIIGIVG